MSLLLSSLDEIWGQLLFFIFLIDGEVKLLSIVLKETAKLLMS